jgi:hypothetical protein
VEKSPNYDHTSFFMSTSLYHQKGKKSTGNGEGYSLMLLEYSRILLTLIKFVGFREFVGAVAIAVTALNVGY